MIYWRHLICKDVQTRSPSGTALATEKPSPDSLSILPRSDRRDAGANEASQVKTIAIRLPDVEATMLVDA